MSRTAEFQQGQSARPTGLEDVSDETLHHHAHELTKHITHLMGKSKEYLTSKVPGKEDRSPPIDTLAIQNMMYDAVDREMKRRGHWD
jgi:hypothetical protein